MYFGKIFLVVFFRYIFFSTPLFHSLLPFYLSHDSHAPNLLRISWSCTKLRLNWEYLPHAHTHLCSSDAGSRISLPIVSLFESGSILFLFSSNFLFKCHHWYVKETLLAIQQQELHSLVRHSHYSLYTWLKYRVQWEQPPYLYTPEGTLPFCDLLNVWCKTHILVIICLIIDL